jgi:hypothetical protein
MRLTKLEHKHKVKQEKRETLEYNKKKDYALKG